MKTEAEALRQELARIAEEHLSTFPSRPMLSHDPTQPPTIHAVWSRGCNALPG